MNYFCAGANVNEHGGYYGYALHAAASTTNGCYGVALQAVAWFSDQETVQILLDRGAKVNVEVRNFSNALIAAVTRGHKPIA